MTRFTLISNLTNINTRRGEVHPRPCSLSTNSSTLQNNTEQFTRLSLQITEGSTTSSIPITLWSNLLSIPLKLTSDIEPFNFQNFMEQFTLYSPQINEQSVSSSIPKTLWSNVLAFLPKLPSAPPWQLTLYQNINSLDAPPQAVLCCKHRKGRVAPRPGTH
jgi:hypothetical protein